MPVERDRVTELIDAEAILRQPRDIGTEQPAAGGKDEPIISDDLFRASGRRDLDGAHLGIDRLHTALQIDNVDRLQHIQQRRRQRFRICLVEAWTYDKRRFRRDEHDFEHLRRNALDVAQACGGERGIHAGKAGADNDDSHDENSLIWAAGAAARRR
jgi:hypothetical protein